MTTNGKGDSPRPLSVPRETYEANYARIFKKPSRRTSECPKDDPSVSSKPSHRPS